MTAPGWPRMMRRTTAALYCDMTAAEFEREVGAGRLPIPIKLGNGERWSRVAIDEALNQLTNDTTPDWRKKAKLYAA